MADKTDRKTGEGVLEKAKPTVKRPSLFKVILHNDDYTTMEFVIGVLEHVFEKSPSEAYRIMMQVHLGGRGVCGAYSYEIAETKAATVHELARLAGYPLLASIEEE